MPSILVALEENWLNHCQAQHHWGLNTPSQVCVATVDIAHL